MRARSSCLVILAFFICISSNSQSIYNFQYNFNNAGDSAIYHAFMLRNNDGSGLLRIRYETATDKQDVLIEMDTDEQYASDKSGLEDTSLLVVKSINPRFIIGDDKTKYILPVFIFKYNRWHFQ